MPALPKLSRADLHFWEEPPISGKKGSGTIFFSGCSLKCVFCQNYELSHENSGKIVTVERLAEIMRELESRGANNINFVNPTHYLSAIKAALEIYKPSIPLVYNSGGYDNAEVVNEDIFDVYLVDFKYISSQKAKKYSAAADYPEVVKKFLLAANKKIPECVFDSCGIMQKGIIVRHLILPLATNDAVKIADFVKENMPGAYFSLMAQYTPMYRAGEFKEISRKITRREYEKVLSHIFEIGQEKVFCQELSSADEGFVPAFDMTGV